MKAGLFTNTPPGRSNNDESKRRETEKRDSMRAEIKTFILTAGLMAIVCVALPLQAQFGTIRKVGGKIKGTAAGAASGAVSGVKTDSSSKDNDAASPGEAAFQNSKPKKTKDGEAVTIQTTLSETDAAAKVKAYLNSKDTDFTVNQDTGRIMSDWYGEHRCGPGFYRCADRASIRVTAEEGRTVVRVQVFERKREGGINQKPWKEGTTSKGKETEEFAAALEAFVAN